MDDSKATLRNQLSSKYPNYSSTAKNWEIEDR